MSVISSDQEEKYQQETHQIIVYFKLPSTDIQADKQWYSLEKKDLKFTKLSPPSTFNGSQVENYFHVMGGIKDKNSNRVLAVTYYNILALRTTGNMKCVRIFRRRNDVVIPRLPFNINVWAAKRQTSELDVTEKSTEL